ncbi:transposase [Streptomyces sp. NPDC057486]|uniref:transposase n=1 Tax=Streptomyces sp. NPDC057486 TaxID=3346145 RepID=UPI0036C0BFC2
MVGRLPRSVGPGQVALADREFFGVPLWRAFTATGVDLLWRVPANRVLPVVTQLRDGAWLSRMRAGRGPARDEPVVVRVLAYQLKDRAGEGAADGYRLVTALRDARLYPARQLAALHRERWEVESVFPEIKTHQRGAVGPPAWWDRSGEEALAHSVMTRPSPRCHSTSISVKRWMFHNRHAREVSDQHPPPPTKTWP